MKLIVMILILIIIILKKKKKNEEEQKNKLNFNEENEEEEEEENENIINKESNKKIIDTETKLLEQHKRINIFKIKNKFNSRKQHNKKTITII